MTVLDQAQNFSGGPIAAARQRDRWARQEANATDDETRESYREAIADLEARYPDLEDVPIGGAEAFARERGHGTGARSPVHEGRRRPGSRAAGRTIKPGKGASPKVPRAGQGKAKPIPGITPGARRSPAQRRAAKGQPTPRVDRAIRQTGIPAAASSGGSVVMGVLGATVGMSLLYLLVTSAEAQNSGSTRLLRLFEHDIPHIVGRFLDPKADVFPAGGSTSSEGEGPVFNEAPGSNIATAAARLKAAAKLPRRPLTREQKRERERRPQGHVHR
ncbi:MAG: hypothetical protein QOF85_953 [Solirubrobacterales bacterium]|jgi:hypothetical protein|nr:hypothetical protein [Solirubrobacterales bacterium]